MQIKLTNRIAERVEEYQKETGASKTWIANKLGISRQNLNYIEKSDSFTIDIAIKLSIFLKCNITDLFNFEIIDE